MSKLLRYARKSEIMTISIVLDTGEKFRFNLSEELQISEDKLNLEAMDQPSAYAFLGMLHQRLIKVADDRKLEMSKAWSEAFSRYKSIENPVTGKNYSDDSAKNLADSNSSYVQAAKAYHEAKYKAGVIGVCVSSFEQRASLIQTISANNRKPS